MNGPKPTSREPGVGHHIRTAVLIGPPGAGKSAAGILLATRWSVPFTDTDHEVASRAGKSVSDIFVEDGEPRFRELEREAVLRAISLLGRHGGVVSLGGGAPLDPQVASALAGLPVVLLTVSIAQAAKRVGLDAPRPLLAVNPRASWQRLYRERRARYEALARITVDTDQLTAAEVAAEIDRQLGEEER